MHFVNEFPRTRSELEPCVGGLCFPGGQVPPSFPCFLWICSSLDLQQRRAGAAVSSPCPCATELGWCQGRRDSPCPREALSTFPALLLSQGSCPCCSKESGNCSHSSVCQTVGKGELCSFPCLFPVAYFKAGCSILVFICTLPQLCQGPAFSGTVLM